jgi:hypothetical protein
MKILNVYIDFSIIRGVFEEEFASYSKLFFGCAIAGDFKIIVSDILEQELQRSADIYQNFYSKIPESAIVKVKFDEHAEELAMKYLSANIPGITSIPVSKHVAVASTIGADIFISWDSQNTANLWIQNMYNSVNLLNKLPLLEIRYPRVLLGV